MKELAITWQDPLQPHGQMLSLPHQGAKHGDVDHGDASDDVFIRLRGRRGRASTSSSNCGRLLELDESLSRMISSILSPVQPLCLVDDLWGI
jgi:hypothetical protein